MTALLLLVLLAGPRPAAAETLVQVMARRDPAAVLDHMAALGRGIDLADGAQVRAAIGDTSGLRTRRSARSEFVGYAGPGGEIVFNPDLPGRILLLVSLEACLPLGVLRERVYGPSFLPPASRITVEQYDEVAYRDRPGMALTFTAAGGCVRTLGLAQQRGGA